MENLHLVHFQEAADLEAIRKYDDTYMNMVMGGLQALQSRNALPAHQDGTVFLAVFERDDLLASLIKDVPGSSWKISSPQVAAGKLTAVIISSAARLFREALLAMSQLLVVDHVIGVEEIVNAFLITWASLSAAPGKVLVLQDPALTWRVSYATAATIPPLVTAPGTISLATTNDLKALIPLHLDFAATSPWPQKAPQDILTASLARAVSASCVWVYRNKGTNVYVLPSHRRRGIAEALVKATTRYYLGATPSGAEGVPEVLAGDAKQEVNLLVVDPSAEGVYRRAGFLFPAAGDDDIGGRDPITGQKTWFQCIWRGVVQDPST